MITFELKGEHLICIYTPDFPYGTIDSIKKKIKKDGFNLKNTFIIKQKNVIKLKDDEDSIGFIIGKIDGKYVKFDKDILGVNFNIYIDKSIAITLKYIKYFISYNNISIFRALLNVTKSDIYIDKKQDANIFESGHIPIDIFKLLINTFPNNWELKIYAFNRISHVIGEYFDNTEKFQVSYEKYLAKKENELNNIESKKLSNILKLDLLTLTSIKLTDMLKNYQSYSEFNWQNQIKDILCILFPKYLYTVREVSFGEINGYDKHPDFTLIDSNGYIDVMEIKKPDENQIMRTAKIRNNYVPQKIFTDVMVQASKYIDVLNKNSDKSKQNLINKLNDIYSNPTVKKENLYINNPKAIVLFGRSNNLNEEQLYDLELIKRQYKDITEIMTYDDLLKRINNLINALKNQVS